MHQKTPGIAAQLSAYLMFHNNMWLNQTMKKICLLLAKIIPKKKISFMQREGKKNISKDDEEFLNKILFLNIPFKTS